MTCSPPRAQKRGATDEMSWHCVCIMRFSLALTLPPTNMTSSIDGQSRPSTPSMAVGALHPCMYVRVPSAVRPCMYVCIKGHAPSVCLYSACDDDAVAADRHPPASPFSTPRPLPNPRPPRPPPPPDLGVAPAARLSDCSYSLRYLLMVVDAATRGSRPAELSVHTPCRDDEKSDLAPCHWQASGKAETHTFLDLPRERDAGPSSSLGAGQAISSGS